MDLKPPTELKESSTTDAIPLAPSLGPTLSEGHIRHTRPLVDQRLLVICAISLGIAAVTSVIALLLVNLISFITNVAFYQRASFESLGPAGHQLGLVVILVPVVGGIIVGLMARYGSKAIRGHGIPEAMEQVLSNESVIPARLTFLKPISAAISIGTGGPFGAEGPIIASGGAFGSVIGQIIKTTAQERKTLLAAGAAAGMTAIFGAPISAVILAIELLVFEYRPRSFVPISIAAAAAGTFRLVLFGAAPAFSMPVIGPPTLTGMIGYLGEGVLIGIASVIVTKLVYWIEDQFEKLPIHWMWWPAMGGLVVGVVGYWFPHTMGVGYDNIDRILSGTLSMGAVALFCFMKLVSWSVSLGTGTSGGTLAPLFTIGGGIGLLYGGWLSQWLPPSSIDLSVAALVGMAAIFAGASRAMMTSVVFAFETTRQPWTLLPLLAGCTAAYIVSCLRMRHTIMTEKIARRGVTVPVEYSADPLAQFTAGEIATKAVVSFPATDSIDAVRTLLSSKDPRFHHHGYPIVNAKGIPIGVLTRKDLMTAENERTLSEITKRPPITVSTAASLNEARDLMVREEIGRLLVTHPKDGGLVGILTRSDLLRAHSGKLSSEQKKETKFPFPKLR
jgi:H+/Cl- antiporter ClcA/CBS domain-containing protein